MNIKVTVGVCVKNSEENVKVALESVVNQDFSPRLMKLVVVDDGSTDKTLSIVKDFVSKIDIKTVVFLSGGKGLGASRQIVVDNAEGNYIVWVDGDLVLRKDMIRSHVDFMEKNPGVGAACAKQIPTGETLVSFLESMSQLLVNSNLKRIGTGGSIFRRKAIKQIGGFDIDIKGAGEDQDISHRLRMSGWKLSMNNSSGFYHKHIETWKSLWDQQFWYGYAHHFLAHKYKSEMMHLWKYFPPLSLAIGLKNSLAIYETSHEKKVLLLSPLYYYFARAARFFGFIRGHLDSYGHAKPDRRKL